MSAVAGVLEGAVAFGLSIALHGEITTKDGAVVQDDFGNYPVCRIDEAPLVEVGKRIRRLSIRDQPRG